MCEYDFRWLTSSKFLCIKQLAQNASTEDRMIAEAVFATLNESWDKFKAENGL